MNKTYSWNLSGLAKSDNDPTLEASRKKSLAQAKSFAKKWQDQRYLTSKSALLDSLKEYETFFATLGDNSRETYYFSLRQAVDQNNQTVKMRLQQAMNVAHEIANILRFYDLSLSQIEAARQKEILKDTAFGRYHHFLHSVFEEGKHRLSEKEEALFTLLSDSSYRMWTEMTEEFISSSERMAVIGKSKKAKTNFAHLMSLLSESNKTVRQSAADALNDILATYADTATYEMNAILKTQEVNDKLRKFPRPDSSRHLSDEIPTKVVDTLIEVVSKNYRLSQRFYVLKNKLLKTKNLTYFEKSVPALDNLPKFKLDDARRIIESAFGKLDPEILAEARHFFDEEHIDFLPAKGKQSGAFCAYNLISMPVFVMMNFTGKVDDVLTLAHELGHGINDRLSQKKVAPLDFGTSLATAEVASTFMEDFALDEIAIGRPKEVELSLLLHKLERDVATIFRQTAFYRFEWEMHQEYAAKHHLSKDEIGGIFVKHMKEYTGPTITYPKGAENWWTYIGHFRRSFYVYSYVSGLLISKALQRMVKENPASIEKVKEFLSAGVSKSPVDIFKAAGIDITKASFWEDGIKEIESTLKRAEKLAKELI